MMIELTLVALGGAAGAALRWLAGLGVHGLLGHDFPWGTAFVNVAGSLCMGVIAVLIVERMGHTPLKLLVMTGVLGGFTTFSSFSLDTLDLVEKGRVADAALYVGTSVTFSILALFAGLWLGRQLWPG